GVGPHTLSRPTAPPGWPRPSSRVEGDAPPWRLALVVVMGPNAFAIAMATVCWGTRIPMRPVDETRGGGAFGVARRRSVTGPGKCLEMTRCASGVRRAYLRM